MRLRRKKKKPKENIDQLEKLTFGIIKSCDWDWK